MSHPAIHQQVTFLYTDDLELSAKFYGEILGLELVLDQGTCQIFRVIKESFLGVCTHLHETGPHDNVIVTLVTDEVDAWYKYLLDNNVPIEKAPNHNSKFNIYQMLLRDPNGYLIEIQEFLSPEWSASA